jgi:hypothetical protein
MPTPTQLSLFGDNPARTGAFCVYHDESGTDQRHARFQFHGALFVPEGRWKTALELLAAARARYTGRIHFVELRDRGRGDKARVAWAWLDLFFAHLSRECAFKCMVADTHSPAYPAERFPRSHDLYNYTAALAVFGGLVWSLKAFEAVQLRLFSEHKTRPRDDDFLSEMPRAVARRAWLKRQRGGGCPAVAAPVGLVRTVGGDPRQVPADVAGHCEFIQLTDLLTSAVAQAVNAGASQRIKLDLASLAAGWVEDTRRPPWLQDTGLHRRFSVSCFPDRRGGFYNVPLGIRQRNQPPLLPD